MNDLQVPLLPPAKATTGNKAKTHRISPTKIDDDDDDVQEVWMVCFAKVGGASVDVDEDVTTPNDEDGEDWDKTSVCGMLLSVCLPALLWFQFYIAFQNPAVDTQQLQWVTVQGGVFFFVVASVLYRQSISSFSSTCMVLQVLPELVTDVVLLLILVHMVETAIVVVHFFTIVLSINAVLNSCTCSVRIEEEQKRTSNDGDEEDCGLDKTYHDRMPLVDATVA